MTPAELDALDRVAAVHQFTSRFSWLDRSTLNDVLAWQSSLEPRPNFYFRWHLPRVFTNIDVLRPHITPNAAVLDISAYLPYSVLMQRYLPARWDRTTYEGGIDTQFQVSSLALDCGDDRWKIASEAYDVAIFAEVIEHLQKHPQHALSEINRVLRQDGTLLVTTPNVTSWKKARLLTDHDWSYDSPTFNGAWGHRYEYSFYQLHSALAASGFEPVERITRDVYFDDPRGVAPRVEMGAVALGKLCTGRLRKAAQFWQRRGSGLFFLYRKTGEPSPEHVTI